MTEVEQTLDTHKEIAVSHEEIKQQLAEQKVQWASQSIQLGLYAICIWMPSLIDALQLGVPETAEVKEAHVRSYVEKWTQPSWKSSNQPRQAASGESTGRTQGHVGHHQRQVYGEVRCSRYGHILIATKHLHLGNSPNALVPLSQATQAGGSTAVLREIHRCSAGPEWLAVQSGAPASWGCSCWWRQGHGAQPDRQTQGTTPVMHFKHRIHVNLSRVFVHL